MADVSCSHSTPSSKSCGATVAALFYCCVLTKMEMPCDGWCTDRAPRKHTCMVVMLLAQGQQASTIPPTMRMPMAATAAVLLRVPMRGVPHM